MGIPKVEWKHGMFLKLKNDENHVFNVVLVVIYAGGRSSIIQLIARMYHIELFSHRNTILCLKEVS